MTLQRLAPLAGASILAAALIGCTTDDTTLGTGTVAGGTETAAAATDSSEGGDAESSSAEVIQAMVEDHDDPTDHEWADDAVSTITLTGSSATATGDGVVIDQGSVTITSPGTYEVTGTLDDGQIVVDTDADGIVRLILAGADITSSTGSPLVIESAAEAMIVLADGTTNTLTDAATYTFATSDEDEPNAALFSRDDLTIAGTGTLIVEGNYNDGIASKDGLVITGGTIDVTAVDDAIRGKDYLVVEGGEITATAGGDALKSDNDDTSLGWITVADATIDVEAGGDGLVANHVTVASGDLDIQAGGGHSASLAADASAKGLKASSTLTIAGGTVTVDAADDAVHSNDTITITDGHLTLATADDGIHADANLVIDGGTITVTDSYEGLESAVITINDGVIDLTSSDDGINVAGGNDGSGTAGPGGARGGRQDQFAASGDYHLYINGGTISILAQGDGLDANGTIDITDGTVVVYGPTAQNNGALDVDGAFTVSGGILVAGGSSRMAEAPDQDSPQASLAISFNSAIGAGSVVQVVAGDGTEIVTYQSPKAIESLVVSTPEVEAGASYEVIVDGTSLGTVTA